ncbi:MAG: homocysteine S-methyltransferase family protein [Verrucomicrobiota bacterium]
MPKKTICESVRDGKILVSDGACGTFLQQAGLKTGECPEMWNLTHRDVIARMAQEYIDAGSDMVQTNSFGGSRFKLEAFDLSEKTREINEAAAAIAREAVGDDHWVIASVGPTGKMLLMGDVTEQELYDAFAEQAMSLARGGADGICVETMSAVDEAVQAIKAAKENTACEVISTFTYEATVQGDYRTMMGVSPREGAQAAVEAGADIVGTNCGNGIAGMVDIVKEIREVYPDVPILVHANAGLPKQVGEEMVFPEKPDEMAAQVPDLITAGADVVGGCCGTTPEHIRAMKNAVKRNRVSVSE